MGTNGESIPSSIPNERGANILRDLTRIAAGLITVEEAAPEISRSPNGRLRITLTEDTKGLIAWRNPLDYLDQIEQDPPIYTEPIE